MIYVNEHGHRVCEYGQPIDPSPHFELVLEHDYDLLTDTLTITVDCLEFERAYRVEWRGASEEMAIIAHWTGFDEHGQPNGCEPSKEECPANEAMELLAWLRSSDDVQSARARWLDKALTIYDASAE